jgi:hypothetical protein
MHGFAGRDNGVRGRARPHGDFHRLRIINVGSESRGIPGSEGLYERGVG